MTIRFNNEYLELLAKGAPVPGKPRFSNEVVKKYRKTLLLLSAFEDIHEIQQLRGLNFEHLKGDLKGFCSVRVDLKYRLILSIDEQEGLVAQELVVENLTNHYQ